MKKIFAYCNMFLFAYIPNVADYNQPVDYPKSCGACSAAIVLNYWGLGDREDIPYLLEIMNWSGEGIYVSDLVYGLCSVLPMDFSVKSIKHPYLDQIKDEIDAQRPVIFGSLDGENPWQTNHYFVIIGYEDEELIVRDNWWSTPVDVYVEWDEIGHSKDYAIFVSDEIPPFSDNSNSGCFITQLVY